MKVSSSTFLFAVGIFIGYQAGFTIAYELFPSALMFIMLPPFMTALMLAIITLPVAYSHSAIVLRALSKATTTADIVRCYGVSLLVVLPIIVALCALTAMSLQSSFPTDMIAPGDAAFGVSNAVWNVIVKNTLTYLMPAWGSTYLMITAKQRSAVTATMGRA